ncbi:MAG: DUF5690 family protein [Cyclobacteriaceae bacterium]
MNDHPITAWLKRTGNFNFTLYASVASFCLYTCIFSLRKTFGAATYEGISYWGIDYKAWMVISQVVGYLISKFIGIKVASELQSKQRSKTILFLVSIATISWLLFAITPRPYNLIFLFSNGLPLRNGLEFSIWLPRRQKDN